MGGSGGVGFGNDWPDGLDVGFLVFAQSSTGVGREDEGASLWSSITEYDTLLDQR